MPVELSPAERERLLEKARVARAAFAHKPTIEELFTPEELAAGAPFYFQMLRCVSELKKARTAAGWDVAETARRAEVGADELDQLERGELYNPDWRLLGRYAVAVGMHLELTAVPKPAPALAGR